LWFWNSRKWLICNKFTVLSVTKSLQEDPAELRAFTALVLAEVKSQAVLIAREEWSCAAG
jgi:hypothetical protein